MEPFSVEVDLISNMLTIRPARKISSTTFPGPVLKDLGNRLIVSRASYSISVQRRAIFFQVFIFAAIGSQACYSIRTGSSRRRDQGRSKLRIRPGRDSVYFRPANHEHPSSLRDYLVPASGCTRRRSPRGVGGLEPLFAAETTSANFELTRTPADRQSCRRTFGKSLACGGVATRPSRRGFHPAATTVACAPRNRSFPRRDSRV